MNLLGGMPPQLIVFIVSMVPLIELRGGLIAAALLGMPYGEAVLYCLAGNIVPVPFILLFITPIFAWLKKTKLFRPMVESWRPNRLERAIRSGSMSSGAWCFLSASRCPGPAPGPAR